MEVFRKSQGVGLEIRLGIAVIILVLAILNIASYYTLYRVRESIEDNIREKLAEASLLAANHMQEKGEAFLDEDDRTRIIFDHSLKNLAILPLNFDRVLGISQFGRADSFMIASDSGLAGVDISPILYDNHLYFFDKESLTYYLLYATEFAGSKYLIISSRSSEILSAVKGAMRVLIVFGIAVGAIVLFVLARLVKNVIRPFGILVKEVRRANNGNGGEISDDIGEVVKSYENMIAELQSKEKELLRINELLNRRADRLEIYNNHILRSIDTGIVTMNDDRSISTVNPSAARYLGIDQYENLGKNLGDAVRHIPELSEILEGSRNEDRTACCREINTRVGGQAKDLLVSLANLRDAEENNIGLVLIINDQTEFNKLRSELENNRRMAAIGEMSGGLAHQLRNSMMAIMGFAKLVFKKSEGNDSAKKVAENLITESRQAESLVSRFLDYARPLHKALETIDIEILFKDIVESSRLRSPGVKIILNNNSNSKSNFIGDYLLLKQAVANIVDNACRAYDGKSGEVRIGIALDSSYLDISISDNAGGIPEDIREQVFTPFISGNPSGTGLGLPLAQKIIFLHGGTITFESETGRGTVFGIRLPLNIEEHEPISSI